MPFRDGDETVLFEGVLMIDRRPMEKMEKSVLCRFPDGEERFVSRAQCPSDQMWPDEEDQLFDLEVSSWMVSVWNETPPEQPVKIADVLCLRETAKAIQVRLPSGGTPEWLPLKGLHRESPVRGDGDRGELWVLPWAAKMKGWDDSAHVAAEDDKRARDGVANVGDDARGGFVDDGDEIPF